MVQAGARAGIFDKLEPESRKNGPAPEHCVELVLARNKIETDSTSKACLVLLRTF
jgi:hypothetical protein